MFGFPPVPPDELGRLEMGADDRITLDVCFEREIEAGGVVRRTVVEGNVWVATGDVFLVVVVLAVVVLMVVEAVVAGLPTGGGFGIMMEVSAPSDGTNCFCPGNAGGISKFMKGNRDVIDEPWLNGNFCPLTTRFPCESV